MNAFPYRIVAHRGARSMTENSMASIKEAFAQQADIVEMDVRMTRDKEFIILHDYFLERTTTGTGWVLTKCRKELRDIRLLNGEPIPTLEEVLTYLRRRKDGMIMLDVKDAVFGLFDVKRFVSALEEHDILHRVIVSSFNPFMLHRIKKRQPQLDIALLTMFPYGIAVPIAKWLKATYVSCILPVAKRMQAKYFSRVLPSETFLSWAQKEGLETMAYWEEGQKNLAWLVEKGVKIFVTNRPAVARQELMKLTGKEKRRGKARK